MHMNIKRALATLLAVMTLALPFGALAESVAEDPYTVFDGVNLTGELTGDNIEMTLVYQNEDGTNFSEYLVDSAVVVSYERLHATTGRDAALASVSALLTAQGVEPRDIAISDDAEASASLGCPAYRLEYTIGEGADACAALDVYAQAGQWDYRFHALMPMNSAEGYRASVESWADSLYLEEISGPLPYGEEVLDAYPRLNMPLAADQIELNDYEQYSEIEYEQWYAYDGGAILFSYERYLPCADSVDAVIETTTGMYDGIEDLNAARDDALSARLGQSAYRVEYLTDMDGVSMQNMDIFVVMSDCGLCFHMETRADEYGDRRQIMDSWVDTLEIVMPAAK